jgi:hypothetical protein
MYKAKTQILFLLLLIAGIKSFAQINHDSMRLQYNQKTMRLGARITMNGMLLSNTTTQNLMLVSPDATNYYKQYLKSRRVSNVLPLFGTAAVISGIFVAQKNRTPGYIMVLSGNSINLIGSLFRRKASIKLQDAIWHYNRDILFPKR